MNFSPHRYSLWLAALLLAGQILSPLSAIRADDHLAARYSLNGDGDSAFTYSVKDATGMPVVTIDLAGWAPGWKWIYLAPSADGPKDANAVFNFDDTKGIKVSVNLLKSKPSDHSYAYKYTLVSDSDIPMTAIMAQIIVPAGQTGGSLTVTSDAGEDNENFPMARADTVANVAKAVFHLAGGNVTLDIAPPCSIAFQPTGFRLVFAADKLKAGTTSTTLTYTLPGAAPSATP